MFLDPIIFTALKQKKKKLISKPFSLKFCKIEPGQSSARALSIIKLQIVLPSIQISKNR